MNVKTREFLRDNTNKTITSCLSVINALCKMKSEIDEKYDCDSPEYIFEERRRQKLLFDFVLALERQHQFLKTLENI